MLTFRGDVECGLAGAGSRVVGQGAAHHPQRYGAQVSPGTAARRANKVGQQQQGGGGVGMGQARQPPPRCVPLQAAPTHALQVGMHQVAPPPG